MPDFNKLPYSLRLQGDTNILKILSVAIKSPSFRVFDKSYNKISLYIKYCFPFFIEQDTGDTFRETSVSQAPMILWSHKPLQAKQA